MLFLGTCFMGENLSCAATVTNVENITYLELKNGIYDYLYVTKDTDFEMVPNYEGKWDFSTILFPQFDGNTSAGNVDWSTDSVSHVIIKRRIEDDFTWRTVYVKKINTHDDFDISAIDYTNASRANYDYAVVPVLNGVEGSYSIVSVYSEFSKAFIIEGDRFISTDLTDGYCDYTRNIPSSTIELLNSRYPVWVSNTIASYDTGEFSGTFLFFDKDDCLSTFDEITTYKRVKYEKEVMDILSDRIPKLLKNFDGNMWLIQITPNPTNTAKDFYANRIITFQWVEIGGADNEEDLYTYGFSDVTEEWWVR